MFDNYLLTPFFLLQPIISLTMIIPLVSSDRLFPLLSHIGAIAAYCYTRSSVVGLSVCVCLLITFCYPLIPAKTAEPNKMPSGNNSRGPREPCIRWSLDPQGEGPILGVVRPIEKHWETLQRCLQKRLNQSRCRLGLTHVGPRKHVLEGSRLDESIGRREGWQYGDAAFRYNSLTTCFF